LLKCQSDRRAIVQDASDLIEAAIIFAEKAHAGQTRKVTGAPYIVHPRRVAEMVMPFVSPAAVAAAYLHDVIEDTEYKDISVFPVRVQQLVSLLTKIPGEKLASIEKVGRSFDEEAMIVKVADRIDNISDGAAHFGNEWAKKYLVTSRCIRYHAQKMGLGGHALVMRLVTSIVYLESLAIDPPLTSIYV
jgi:(p)ppGpp synthase/HD superfamily hydrolase